MTLLITSRAHLAESHVRPISIETLTRNASVALLTDRTNVRSHLGEHEWSEIAEWLGDLPLALEVINRALSFNSISPRELLAVARTRNPAAEVDRQMAALSGHVALGSLRGVAEALLISYRAMSSTARHAVRLLAWFASAPIPIDLYNALGPDIAQPHVRAELIGRSILSPPGEPSQGVDFLGSMHRVTADFVRSSVPHPRTELLRICRAITLTMSTNACYDPHQWRSIDHCLPHADGFFWRAVQARQNERASTTDLAKLYRRVLGGVWRKRDLPLAVANVGLAVRNYRYAQGLWGDAQRYSEVLVNHMAVTYGNDSDLALQSRAYLADVLRRKGDHEGAIRLHQQAVTHFSERFGEADSVTLRFKSLLAAALLDSKSGTKAVPILEELVAVKSRTLGQHAHDTLVDMGNLAMAYKQLGKKEMARTYAEKTWKLFRQTEGEDHPDTIKMFSVFAELQSDPDERCKMLELALALFRKSCGEDHYETLVHGNDLAVEYGRLRRRQDAKQLYERVLDGWRRKPPTESHRHFLLTLHNLAWTNYHLGDYVTARSQFAEAHEKRSVLLGPEDEDTLNSLEGLASTLYAMDQDAEAADLFSGLLTIKERTLGPEHADTLETMYDLARALYSQKRYREAADLFQAALSGRRRVLGVDHSDTVATLYRLGLAYDKQDDYVAAKECFSGALEIQFRTLGRDCKETLDTMHSLAYSLGDLGEFGSSSSLLAETFERKSKLLGPSNESTLRTMHSYGYGLFRDKQFGAAREIMESAVRLRKEVFGPENSRALVSENLLGAIYLALNDLEGANQTIRQTLDVRVRLFGPESDDAADSYQDAGRLSEKQGLRSDATELFERAYRIRLREFGPRDALTSSSAEDLLRILSGSDIARARTLAQTDLSWVLAENPTRLGFNQRSLLRVVQSLIEQDSLT